MTTQYTAWKDGDNYLETDSKQNLEMDLAPTEGKVWAEDDGTVHYSSGQLTEDQLVEIGVGVLGPLFYFTDDKAELTRKIKAEFGRRGFTYSFET